MAEPVSARRAWPILWILLFWAGTSLAVSGDQPDLTYHTTISEVRLAFSATDQNGHGVATLSSNDFAVVDTGFIVRDFQSFTRSDYSRLEIAILIDSSESVSPHVRKEIADTLELLQETSGVPEENISLLSFRDAIRNSTFDQWPRFSRPFFLRWSTLLPRPCKQLMRHLRTFALASLVLWHIEQPKWPPGSAQQNQKRIGREL